MLSDQIRGLEQAKCKNCSSALTGEYCAVCGQREGRGDLRLSEALGGFFLLALVLYLPLSLRRVYGSSIVAALAKSVAIGFLYRLLLIAGFILTTMVTLALM